MAEETLKEDDLDIVEVEELPEPGKTPEVKVEAAEGDDDDKDDVEDSRLADQDDDDDDDAPPAGEDSAAKKKRLKRRQIQKQAKDRTLAELAFLREQLAESNRRLAAVEGSTLNANESQLDAKIAEVRRDAETAERIIAKAVEAGNGDDVTAAMRLRDEAKASEAQLMRAKDDFTEARKRPGAPDPAVATHKSQWMVANADWYGAANPDATRIANEIDTQVARDGYNPGTPAYWQELTRRVRSRFETAAPRQDPPAKPPKKAPPQGNGGDHAPASTRQEVYVTPERKAAMQLAGKWDDPQERAKMLRAYAQYDREQSANR